MTVEPIDGEPLRFLVASWSRSGLRHLVDFTTGSGRCSCEHYTMTIQPSERGKKKVAECWHIQRVREFIKVEFARNFNLPFRGKELEYVTKKLFEIACKEATRWSKGAVGQNPRCQKTNPPTEANRRQATGGLPSVPPAPEGVSQAASNVRGGQVVSRNRVRVYVLKPSA